MEVNKQILVDLLADAHNVYFNASGIEKPAKGAKGIDKYYEGFSDHIARFFGKSSRMELQYYHGGEPKTEGRVNDNNYSDWLKKLTNEVQGEKFNPASKSLKTSENNLNWLLQYAQQDQDVDVGNIVYIYPEITKKEYSREARFFEKIKNDLTIALKKSEGKDTVREFLDKDAKLNELDSRLFLVSDPALLTQNVRHQELKGVKIANRNAENFIRDNNGVLICHALSLHTDSIFLLAELGRFFRLVNTFNIENRVMFLTDRDFGGLNWIVNEYEERSRLPDSKYKGLNIDHNLSLCRKFRRDLYTRLFGSDNIKDVGYSSVSSDFKKEHSRDDLELESRNYSEFCRKLFGPHYTDEKLTSDQVELLKGIVSDYANGKTIPHLTLPENELLDNGLIRDAIKVELDVIIQIIEKFKSINLKTINYFLLQYYNQLRFNGYLKVSVSREDYFDETFDDLSDWDTDTKGYSLNGIYYNDYKVLMDGEGFENGELLTVHPYYFPSGLLNEKVPDVEETFNYTILLNSNIETVRSIVKRYINHKKGKYELAKIVSDLLCFLDQFYYKKERARNSKFYEDFEELQKGFSNKFRTSWKHYTELKGEDFARAIKRFDENVFSSVQYNFIVPYWYFPFVSVNSIVFEKERNKAVNDFTEIINLALQSIRNDTNYREWKII